MTESHEEKEEKRIRKNYYNRRRTVNRRLGLSWPLLDYIQAKDPKKMTPGELHREALKHRHMYPSSLSFVLALRSMWNTLGFTDAQVHDQNKDANNLHHPHWSRSLAAKEADDLSRLAYKDPASQPYESDTMAQTDHTSQMQDCHYPSSSNADEHFGDTSADNLATTSYFPALPLSESDTLDFGALQPFDQGDSFLHEDTLTFE